MATIFRKMYTQPLPKNTEIVDRRGRKMALWRDRRGRKHYDEITTGRRGQTKIIRESPMWIAQYRDATGKKLVVPTGCRDEQAARQVLANLVRRVEHIKAGILTPEQDRQATHAVRSLAGHIEDYHQHMRAKTIRGRKVSEKHRTEVKRRITAIAGDCNFTRLTDINREAMEKWMNRKEKARMGARTRNTYRAAIMTFCNWCVETDRLAANPLAKLCPADETCDRRRTRRALSEEEVYRLLTAARLRRCGVWPQGREQAQGRVQRQTDVAQGRSHLRRSRRRRRARAAVSPGLPRAPGRVGTPRPGTGVDLQDDGAHWLAEGRTGQPDHRATCDGRSATVRQTAGQGREGWQRGDDPVAR